MPPSDLPDLVKDGELSFPETDHDSHRAESEDMAQTCSEGRSTEITDSESNTSLTPSTSSSSASAVYSGIGPSSEAAESTISLATSFAGSTTSSSPLIRTNSRSSLKLFPSKPALRPKAQPPPPDLTAYGHLPIIGPHVPLPHESTDEKRKVLPLFRQPHTVGQKSRLARPILANRIESF